MRKIILALLFSLLCFPLCGLRASAEELTPMVNTDKAANAITVKAQGGEEIGAVYIKWNKPVSPYQIEAGEGIWDCGQYGSLHEFVPLTERCSEVKILLPNQNMKLGEVRIFTDTEVPEDVQRWEPPHERADILLVSSHSDDEILFMGGIIPTYAAEQGARVQVVYMTEFWSSAPIREHEKLDGLWVDGLRNYPVCGNFPDVYAGSLEEAEKKYDLQAMTDYLTDTIRRFQPQVVVTHDFNGEYGHGFHRLTAKAVSLALDAAADDTCRADTDVYLEKGSWDVPKAYFHLYPENPIRMDLNVPLESMGGQTALEVAKKAYLQHVSQQWCWFYVSDTYEYSCADFGLYRTSVGYDTENSMLDNLVLYSVQEEEERLRQEEEERARLAEEERLAAKAQLQEMIELAVQTALKQFAKRG